jgi:hypothetical protein
VEVAFAQWFQGHASLKSIQSQLAPTSLVCCACSALACSQTLTTSLLCCACSTLACFFARFALRASEIYAHLSCSLRSPHQVDSTQFSGAVSAMGLNSLSAALSPAKAFGQVARSATFSHALGPSVGDMFTVAHFRSWPVQADSC